MMGDECLTAEELALIGDAQFFRTKAVVMTKVRTLLDGMYGGLRAEMAGISLLVPPDFDPDKHQFVKGEHLEHCPYQYLDYPKHFAGTTTFTFRTLLVGAPHGLCALAGRDAPQTVQAQFDRSLSFSSRPGTRDLPCPQLLGMETWRGLYASHYA